MMRQATYSRRSTRFAEFADVGPTSISMRSARGISIAMAAFFSPGESTMHSIVRAALRGRAAFFPAIVALIACTDSPPPGQKSGQSPEQGKMVEAPAIPKMFELGAEPTAARIAAVDIDANPTGAGLPEGEGTYANGAVLYSQKCAACHGAKGEGAGTFPRLIGIEHQRDFAFADDPKYVKTIGNYWPYATTLYDYVHRTMPYSAPGSLQPDEVYSIVAFLLAENAIVPRTAVINRETLLRIEMPARNRFVKDDRAGGPEFK